MLHGTTLMTPGRGVARPSCNGNPRPALAGSSEVASGVMICGACTLSRSLKTSEPVRFLIAFAYSPILYHKNAKSQLKRWQRSLSKTKSGISLSKDAACAFILSCSGNHNSQKFHTEFENEGASPISFLAFRFFAGASHSPDHPYRNIHPRAIGDF